MLIIDVFNHSATSFFFCQAAVIKKKIKLKAISEEIVHSSRGLFPSCQSVIVCEGFDTFQEIFFVIEGTLYQSACTTTFIAEA